MPAASTDVRPNCARCHTPSRPRRGAAGTNQGWNRPRYDWPMTDPAPPGPLVLAIDLGTGGPKVALVGLDGSVRAHAVRTTDLLLTEDGGVEQDPAQWWSTICDAAARGPGRQRRRCGGAGGQRHRPVDGHGAGRRARPPPGQRRDLDGQPWAPPTSPPSSVGDCRISGYEPRKLRTWLRYTGGAPSPTGQGLPGPHPLAPAGPTRSLRPGPRLPRADGLPQRPALRTPGRRRSTRSPAPGWPTSATSASVALRTRADRAGGHRPRQAARAGPHRQSVIGEVLPEVAARARASRRRRRS